MAKVQDLRAHSGEYVTVSELAHYWRVSQRTIYRHILKGALPAVRIALKDDQPSPASDIRDIRDFQAGGLQASGFKLVEAHSAG